MSLPPTPDLWHLRPHTTQDIELTHMSQVHEHSEASVVGRVTSTLQQEHPLDWHCQIAHKCKSERSVRASAFIPRFYFYIVFTRIRFGPVSFVHRPRPWTPEHRRDTRVTPPSPAPCPESRHSPLDCRPERLRRHLASLSNTDAPCVNVGSAKEMIQLPANPFAEHATPRRQLTVAVGSANAVA